MTGPAGAHYRREDVRVQCWCGRAFPLVPWAKYNAATTVYCSPECGDLPPLSRESEVRS